MALSLRFGIPSLDGLFDESDYRENDVHSSGRNDLKSTGNVSICINGPEGAGKSVLALHLASRYVADCSAKGGALPMTLYISTDLKHGKALEVWYKFCLNMPNQRTVPFSQKTVSGADPELEVLLTHCPPFQIEEENVEKKPLSYFLSSGKRDPKNPEVYFVDLASNTAGDDWGFISRVLSVVERPERPSSHLMIIDSVEGFETLVGEFDAYGETQSRRTRIAQIMRAASDKWHIIFIVEEPDEREHLPEGFVTDVVIHLRSVQVRDYVRRTVEIVKARGQSHVRGQHAYFIRSGGGSTTGEKTNPDDPRVSNHNGSPTQSYVQVCPSLHYLNRKIMTDRGKGRPTDSVKRYAAFGIRYLDGMLDGETDDFNRKAGDDKRGLPCGTTTALIGNSQTQKSPLGIAFLCRSFRNYAERFFETLGGMTDEKAARLLRAAESPACDDKGPSVEDEWRQAIYQRLKGIKACVQAPEHWANESYEGYGDYIPRQDGNRACDHEARDIPDNVIAAALELGPPNKVCDGIPVLLTTQDVHAKLLAVKFIPWLLRKIPDLKRLDQDEEAGGFGCLAALRVLMEERIICRRLEIHDMPSAVLVHILQRSVETAQRFLFGGELPESSEERFKNSWGIRVVIDDFSILRNTYIGIREDPLLLRFLVFYLGREGVTTLLIDTQEGHPDLTVASHLDSELRSLVEHHIYTWRFPFYDGNRVAIAAIPSIRPQAPTIIRELRSGTGKGTGPEAAPLVVDPHFELYSGIEKGEPRPIPLEVRLFEESPPFKSYIAQLNKRCSDLFMPLKGDGSVITGIPAEEYERLREFVYIQRDTRLDHTLVFHVDEFWEMKRPGIRRSGASHPQWEYLNAKTSTSLEKGAAFENKPERVWAVDPFGWFQKTILDSEEEADGKIDPSPDDGDDETLQDESAYRRCHAFRTRGYTLMDGKAREMVDRVPFTWDFGFLLCRLRAWEDKSSEVEMGFLKKASGEKWGDEKYKKVSDVWKRMPKATKDKAELNGERPSWRVFLEACYQLARAQTYSRSTLVPAFDLHISAITSLSSLILEIWASEIFINNEEKRGSLIDLIAKRHWHPTGEGLINWIAEYKLELFKTWLLLVEVINLQDLTDAINEGNFRFREPNPGTVAVRHWYKSACRSTENFSIDDPVIPVGLPGHFSVRGDWFLGVAGGSRSERLANQVLDFLNTQGANYERLHHGIGLPVRKIVTDQLRTSIITLDRGEIKNRESSQNRRVSRVLYDNLVSLGSSGGNRDDSGGDALEPHDKFYWFWRSGLAYFFHHSKIWHKWLCHTILWWNRMRKINRDEWVSGFERYDLISREYPLEKEKSAHLNIEAWKLFEERCNYLIKELKQATHL